MPMPALSFTVPASHTLRAINTVPYSGGPIYPGIVADDCAAIFDPLGPDNQQADFDNCFAFQAGQSLILHCIADSGDCTTLIFEPSGT